MVRFLLLQGKTVRAVVTKTRSATIKNTPKKLGNKINRLQPKKVPIERKENVSFQHHSASQPCCSHSSSSSTSSHRVRRVEKTLVARQKPKKVTEKSNKTNQRNSQSSGPAKQKQIVLNKDKKIKRPESETDSKRIQLREICFVKDAEGGKKVIAKYQSAKKEEETVENNLVVAWNNNSSSPKVFSNRVFTSPPAIAVPTEAGPSRHGAFRVHNFRRPFPNIKRNQRMLRRLSSTTDNTNKIDKLKKRKKIKGKLT